MPNRPDVPPEMFEQVDRVLSALPEVYSEGAWVGVRWRVGKATVAHLFGGEDQRFRIVFRAAPDEVAAFEHLGEPYFRAGWGSDVVGMILDDDTDWDEVGESLTEAYLLRAPARLAHEVRPPQA